MSNFDDKIAQLYEELHAGRLTEEEFEKERERLIANLEFQSSESFEFKTTEMDEFQTEAFAHNTETLPSEGFITDYRTQDSFLSEPNTTIPSTTFVPSQSIPPLEEESTVEKKSLGQYFLLEQIGEGGMGVVYRATHKVAEFAQMTGDVAIKILHPQFTQNSEFRLRFMAEANFGRTIQHPNIVRIYDVLVDNEQYALVMDLIEGEALREMIRHYPMTIEEALELLEPVAKAIDYLNEKGIIHRDIKPENIIIKADRQPVILDMGIAKGGAIEGTTQTDLAIGTPAYMAPEQIDAKNITGAADRYALGMTLYRCITGTFPWPKRIGRSELISRKFNNLLDPPEGLPANVSDALMKMLSSNPVDRFNTCEAFMRALRNPEFTTRKKREPQGESTITISDEIETLMIDIPPPPPYKIHLEGEISTLKSSGFFSLFGKGKPKIVKQPATAQIDMVAISAGSFTMGSKYGNQDEKPPHAVFLPRHYFISQTPITQAQWELVMGNIPCKDLNPDHPVEQVSWNDCIDFCNALSQKEGLTPVYKRDRFTISWDPKADGYRLPTEAEWAKAAKGSSGDGEAGTDVRFAGSHKAEDVAWFDRDSPQKVRGKQPNDYDLYDMNGNVWEWCWDFYDANIYKDSERLNPTGAKEGRHRVTRGGSWKSLAKLSRVSLRGQSDPIKRSSTIGFRIARNGR